MVLRLVQGFGVGGEWGGAILIATENASPRRKALYGSFAQFGVPIGVLTSNLAFLPGSGMADDGLLAYGWRIPFLISVVLVVVGFLVPSRLRDTPEFERVKRDGAVARIPIRDLVRRHPRGLVLGSLASERSAGGVRCSRARPANSRGFPIPHGPGSDARRGEAP
ncbi:MFS transporter [Amycolatopsis sp. MtRt-6]|uniref:MFS transporter n=1 Tax=Amycolatopsis sp. MtRt-6 TaxID=2792782 RepID=UPI0027DDEDC2|nr:MFS transporter [Amycolatopsis sp. MtRt-6]